MAHDFLDSSIKHVPNKPQMKNQLIQMYWGSINQVGGLAESPPSCSEYFQYYDEQCRLSQLGGTHHVLLRTHRDIIDVVALFRQGLPLDNIRAILKQEMIPQNSEGSRDVVQDSIDFVVRLLLMTDIGGFEYLVGGFRTLEWKNGSLEDFIHQTFKPSVTLLDERVKLDRVFNARNMVRLAGLEIIWTNNLADHLRMRDDDRRVAIFHHASFLEYQRTNSLFDDDFIDETLRTLALLFPRYDKKTRKWYTRLSSRLGLDPRAMKREHLRAEDRHIENFIFWHDRLVILKQIFDEGRPSTLQQWWHDRRDGVQWYTFWLAVLILVLTIFFGFVQSVEGALQVYIAYHPS